MPHENVKSFTKLEIHNISQHCHGRTEPQATCTKNLMKFKHTIVVSNVSRWTHSHAYRHIHNNTSHYSMGKVIMIMLRKMIGFTFLVIPFWYLLTRLVRDKVQGTVKQL